MVDYDYNVQLLTYIIMIQHMPKVRRDVTMVDYDYNVQLRTHMPETALLVITSCDCHGFRPTCEVLV